MDYTPRYVQPFTLAEAIGLDVPVITEEISRLQNSLRHLRETQETLKSVLEHPGEPDEEIAKAFEENRVVIGGQEERISILKMALTEKGIISGSHYDPQPATAPSNPPPPDGTTIPSQSTNDAEDEGVYL